MVVCTAVTAGLSAVFADRCRLTICCRQCNSFYMIDVFRFFSPRRYCFPHWSCFVVISSHLHLCIEFGYSDCVNDQCLASLLTYFRLFWSRVASFQRINFTDVAYVTVRFAQLLRQKL